MAKKYTTLSRAVMADDAKAAKAMIDAGVDVNEFDCVATVTKNSKPMRWTPLHLAALCGKTECLKMLLKANANCGVRSSNRKTALHLAATRGNEECIRILIDAGADVNAKDRYGNTAVICAATIWDAECIRILIDAGADVNAKDRCGDTALHLAGYGYFPKEECVRLLIDAGADVNAKDRYGNTALHLWAGRRNVQCVRLLIEAGADVNAKDRHGKTPKENIECFRGGVSIHYEEIASILDEQKLNVELPAAGSQADCKKDIPSI